MKSSQNHVECVGNCIKEVEKESFKGKKVKALDCCVWKWN